MGDSIEKVSIIISKGSLEGIYPGLIMANGARAEGIEANLFFTFFGLDAIHRKRLEHIKVAAVGNPGMHMASLVGVLPGMSAIATRMMEKKMEAFDIPGIPEFMELIGDTGCGMYACKASVDLFGFTEEDFIEQVQGIITVGEFYGIAAGGDPVELAHGDDALDLLDEVLLGEPEQVHRRLAGIHPAAGVPDELHELRDPRDVECLHLLLHHA